MPKGTETKTGLQIQLQFMLPSLSKSIAILFDIFVPRSERRINLLESTVLLSLHFEGL